MSPPHSKLVQDSIKYLNSLPNTEAFPYIPGPYGKRSVYDIIACYKGYFCAIEIKIGKDTPSPLQRVFGRKINGAHGFEKVCWSLDEVKQFVKDIDRVLNENTPGAKQSTNQSQNSKI